MPPKLLDVGIRKRLWVGILLVLGLVFLLSAMRYLRPPEQASSRPPLALMTTLPLQWSEGGIEAAVASDAEPHPAYARLAERYNIKPIDDFAELDKRRFPLLLLAQPRAFSPQELVALDKWVRGGGRLLVLVDPALQWGSLYPLGDKRRPLFTSLLSPLFSHWGVELVLPITDDQPMALREVDGLTIRTQTPGEWQAKPGGLCAIASHKLLADCRVGKGRAFLVADADLLDTPYWDGQGVRALTGSDEFANIKWFEALLAALRRNGRVGDFVDN